MNHHPRLLAQLKRFSASPRAIIFGMRLVGFIGTSASLFYLEKINYFGHDTVFVPLGLIAYVLYTTFLFFLLMSKHWREQNLLLSLFLLDMLAISSTYYVLLAGGGMPAVLNPLYIVILIASSLLGGRYALIVGATAITTYTLAHFASAKDFETMFTTEYATRAITFVFYTLLAVVQGYYFTSIVKKRDEDSILKDQFVFTTAHDFRSPLALIRLIADKYEKAPSQNHINLGADMRAINANISVALSLLDNLLGIAKGENIPAKIVPIALSPMIASLLERLEPFLQKKSVQYTYDQRVGCMVMGDKQKLEYVLDHIIDNAIKYNTEGGSLRIWHEVSGKICNTMIADTGCGISKENILKVFTPYFRETKDQEVPGAGLGLYGSKKFIDQMGGSIKVVSGEVGTTVTIALPIERLPR